MARLTKRTLHGWELAAPCAPGVPLAALARYENIGSAHQFRHLSELNTPKSPYPDGEAFWSVLAVGAVNGSITPMRARPTSAGNADRRSTGPSPKSIAGTVST